MPIPTRRASAPLFLALLLALTPFWAGCDSGETDPPENLNILFGVSINRLFSEPSAAEIDAVRADWASRSPEAANGTVVAQADVDDATVYVVSHTMSEGPGAPFTHYGVVRVPDGVGDDAPVLVVHHGGDSGFSIATGGGYTTGNASLEVMADIFPTLFSTTVQVVPVYRSEPILAGVGGLAATYTSGGNESPWDYDVDDSIALLSVALDLFADETDEDNIGALGYSRGANVALLHQIRDDRIDAVTEYYGPSDFYNPVAETLAAGLLSGDPRAVGLPGGTFLREQLLLPLQGASGAYDADADYAGARLEVVRRSASLFKGDLMNVQIHHHTLDPVVPYAFSQAFDARSGSVSGGYEFNTYTNALPAGVLSPHAPRAMPESLPATEAWFSTYIGAGLPTVTDAEPILF